MEQSHEAVEMGERLASIRAKLARMREESRASLAQLADALADADERASARPREEPPAAAQPPAP